MTKFDYAERKAEVAMARAFVTAAQKRYEAAKAAHSALVGKMKRAMERREQEYYALAPMAA